MEEKISYLFPYVRLGDNNSSFNPILTYECNTLPIKVNVQIAFYFICLKSSETYRIWLDIKKDGNSVIDDSWDRNKIFKAEDPNSKPDEIAVGLNVDLPDIPFREPGIYEIEAVLYSASRPAPALAENNAFFKVMRKDSAQ